MPVRKSILDWYCSDNMWWMSWPDNVEGWWQRAQKNSNVLFVHYEELKQDLPGMVTKIAKFLDTELTTEERDKIVVKAGFEYMKEHEYFFEMFSPNIFSVSNSIGFMQSGSLNRHEDTDNTECDRINVFCREKMKNSDYPLALFYPDVAHGDLVKRNLNL